MRKRSSLPPCIPIVAGILAAPVLSGAEETSLAVQIATLSSHLDWFWTCVAALGVFILWFGWFGFNAGSTTSMDGGSFARVAFVTNLSAAAGAIVAMFTSWIKFGKPDISMTLNGALAGLVGITAGCYTMTPLGGVLTGVIAGILVVFSVLLFDKIKVDDPVGAVSVHGVCGAWGTFACAIPFFCIPGKAGSFGTQITGIAAIFAFAFIGGLIMFFAIKTTVGLRVDEGEEDDGLDITEHGLAAYPDFQSSITHA